MKNLELPPDTIDEDSESNDDIEDTTVQNTTTKANFDYNAPDLGDDIDIDDI